MSVEFSFISSKPGKKQHVFQKNKAEKKSEKVTKKSKQSYCNK